MSFLTAPQPARYTFPPVWTEGVGGVIAMSELKPMGGRYASPGDWPPRSDVAFGNEQGGAPELGGLGRHKGRGHGHAYGHELGRRRRARIMAGLDRATKQQLKAYRRKLQAQGVPRDEIKRRVLAARSKLAAGLNPAPAVPGAAGRAGGVGQGSYVSPGQLPQAETTPLNLADEAQRFTMEGMEGMGQMSPAAAARIYALQQQAAALARGYVQPSTAKGGQAEGGARMYVDPTAQLQTSYIEGKIQLEPICDESGTNCIAYVEPEYVQKMIGQKVGGVSALGTGQMALPAFYAHPQLGPWGVDPTQAYQYWAAQQAAMQAAPMATLMPGAYNPYAPAAVQAQAYGPQGLRPNVFGSPGVNVAQPMLPMAPGASAAFNPVPGSQAERF